MTTRGEIGWQTDKTLGECMCHMLDNDIATDLCFSVGPPDGPTVDIKAHKYMLISRSPVFEAMFSSGMTECRSGTDEKIRIEDISADIFKALLRFMYTDSVDISAETAHPLMYAAKKYMLPRLSTVCSNLLQTCLNVENACFLLDQSFLFCEENLRDDCLNFISNNSDEVLKSEHFLEASRQVVASILKNEKMRSTETFVFQSYVNWAKHQLLPHEAIENPSDEQIRETLGSLLYDIRFPTMDPEEFADLVGSGRILNGDEKSSIYFYFIKKEKPETLLFDVTKRHIEEICVNRTIMVQSGQWNSEPLMDSIAFTVDKDVKMSGLGLFSGFDGTPYDVDIEISQGEKSLLKKRFAVPFTGNSKPFRIPLDSPISIHSGLAYTVAAFAQGFIGHYGRSCKTTVKSSHMTLTFSNSNQGGSTNVSKGQIPQLYFF